MNRHRHQWTEVGRVFAPPTYGSKVKGVPDEMIEQMCFGVTSIELRCDCGDIGERRLLGNHLPRAFNQGGVVPSSGEALLIRKQWESRYKSAPTRPDPSLTETDRPKRRWRK